MNNTKTVIYWCIATFGFIWAITVGASGRPFDAFVMTVLVFAILELLGERYEH